MISRGVFAARRPRRGDDLGGDAHQGERTRTMASPEQIKANRMNAKHSTGPHRTERSRFNGLKHGLRAEQTVIPGEDPAAFDAELEGWRDDWRPTTHTAFALCERAAAANWKLRRATRVEGAR